MILYLRMRHGRISRRNTLKATKKQPKVLKKITRLQIPRIMRFISMMCLCKRHWLLI